MNAVLDARSDRDLVERRADALFRAASDEHHRRTDRLFGTLMWVQWAFAVLYTLVVSPYGWEGTTRTVNVHVPTAVVLGGMISSLPLVLIHRNPGAPITRHVIACAQMLWSALLIHLSGGRIEMHFHIFGSLAFLAFYRDYRVLVPATLVVAGDHLVRGLVYPESVYGIANPEWWRFLEHAGWVVFEDVVLVVACVRGVAEMRLLATQRAELELLSDRERAKSAALDAALGELRASQAALVRTEKLAAVGQLAASVGHELRNPIAAARNAQTYVVRRLDTATTTDPRIKQFLGIIDRELAVCTRIIGDLLDFARERPPRRAPCPLRALVDEAKSVVDAKAVSVLNDVPDDLPMPSIDRDQFRQVLVNLVQNAIEAIPDGRPGTVRVHASASARGEGLEIVVADDGIGMPGDTAARMFEPLYTTKAKGTGLGLAIVSNIVRAHEGRIHVESEVNRGTRLVIALPTEAVAVA